MRIIIIGGGEIGHALAKALAPLHDTFVIDNDIAVADRFGSLDVQFIEKLRDEQRFDGAEALKAQIDADIAAARSILAEG